ncbi:MAG: GtrA family protein [Gammaproteobacteria bacterium]
MANERPPATVPDRANLPAEVLRTLLRRRGTAEFFRFCAVGGSGVVVNLGAYALFTRAAGMAMEIASPIAIEISLITNFLLNERWTFAGRRLGSTCAQRLLRFHAVCLVGGAINYAALLVLVRHGWWDLAANMAGIALGVAAKFAASAYWTWKEHPTP